MENQNHKSITLRDNQSYQSEEGMLVNKWNRNSYHANLESNGQIDEPAFLFLQSISSDMQRAFNDTNGHTDFLFNSEEYKHNTNDEFINITGSNKDNFTLKTGNVVGFVKKGDYGLNISSRFGDSFLQYIIADTDGFREVENIGGAGNKKGHDWLLAYLWNIKFMRAYRLGIPKTYVTKTEMTSKVRGSIDPVDYFLNKTSGKYLCSYREHSYSSPATSLFIKAYELIKSYSFCEQTRGIYNSFVIANQGIKRSYKEIMETPHFTNPFYNDYNILIDLSKRIITQHGINFGSIKDDSAFLFDVSMLFEYFIRKLLIRNSIILREVSGKEHPIPTAGYSNKGVRKLIPDIVFESNGGLYVFDVKYKNFNTNKGVKREDLFQLHTYIGQYANERPIGGCGFIYPMPEDEWDAHFNVEQSLELISDVIRQHGSDIHFHVMFLKVPKDNESGNFNQLMKEQCDVFIDTLKSRVLQIEELVA